MLLEGFHSRLPDRPWLTVRTGLDDEALRDLYRTASCLLLPLLDASACTAIVEAMACGLPIVSSAVGGTEDYVTADVRQLCPRGDAGTHAAAASAILAAPEVEAAERSRRVRASSARFALPTVATMLHDVLRSIDR